MLKDVCGKWFDVSYYTCSVLPTLELRMEQSLLSGCSSVQSKHNPPLVPRKKHLMGSEFPLNDVLDLGPTGLRWLGLATAYIKIKTIQDHTTYILCCAKVQFLTLASRA